MPRIGYLVAVILIGASAARAEASAVFVADDRSGSITVVDTSQVAPSASSSRSRLTTWISRQMANESSRLALHPVRESMPRIEHRRGNWLS